LKLQGMRDKTIDGYSPAVRRLSERFDCCRRMVYRPMI